MRAPTQEWNPGDTISLAANHGARTLWFAKNDESWVKVFTDCDFGGKGLYPSLFLDGEGDCEVNLGGAAFVKAQGPDENGTSYQVRSGLMNCWVSL